MFRKLVSNLSFSPGLINQFAFYTKRLKQEESIRRLGLFVTVLAIAVQTFAVIAPAKPSLAASDTDLIYGGGSKARIIKAYKENTDGIHQDIKAVFDYWGIGEKELNEATDNITIRSSAQDFWTVGRRQRTTYPTDDQVTVEPAGLGFKVYYRNLRRAWHPNTYKDYPAIRGTTKSGKPFWVLKTCGNIVTDGKWDIEPKPDLNILKEVITPTPIIKDQEVKFKIAYSNGGTGAASNVKLVDTLPKELQFVRLEPEMPLQKVNGQIIEFRHSGTPNYVLPGQTAKELTLVTKLIKPSKDRICNSVTITADGGLSATANACIVTVVPEPDEVCKILTKFKLARDKYGFNVQANAVDGATISSYSFDFGDGEKTKVNTTDLEASVEHTYKKTGTFVAKATVNTSDGPKTSAACSVNISVLPPDGNPMIGREKLVSNLTKNLLDKTSLVASAGDELEYKLIVRNVGDADQPNFSYGTEDMADVMDYATIVSASNNGVIDLENKLVRWKDKITIPAGTSVTRTIKVKVVSPIPTTAPSASDPSTFDLRMVNVFGNQTVIVDLEKPVINRVIKDIERLPNTGPGSSMLISFVVCSVIGYFFARSRLMAKEAMLIKEEYSAGAF